MKWFKWMASFWAGSTVMIEINLLYLENLCYPQAILVLDR